MVSTVSSIACAKAKMMETLPIAGYGRLQQVLPYLFQDLVIVHYQST
jgi:hypothetical protein